MADVKKLEKLRDIIDDALMEAGAVRFGAGNPEIVQDALIDAGDLIREILALESK